MNAMQNPNRTEEVDLKEELRLTVHHLCGMLRTVKRLNPDKPMGAVSIALETHLKSLSPETIGLPEIWNGISARTTAARIEALARAEAHAEGLTEHEAPARATA